MTLVTDSGLFFLKIEFKRFDSGPENWGLGEGGLMKVEGANKHLGAALILSLMMMTAAISAGSVVVKKRSTVTLTGTVSDSLCAMDHGTKTAADAECTRTCVELGAQYALVVGRHVYELQGHHGDLERFAGNEVRVEGRMAGRDTVTVDQVSRWYSEAYGPN